MSQLSIPENQESEIGRLSGGIKPFEAKGIELITKLLYILAGSILISISILAIVLWHGNHVIFELIENSKNLDTSQFKDRFEIVTKQQSEIRLSIKEMTQLILINLLLPLVTALIGYIFASRKES